MLFSHRANLKFQVCFTDDEVNPMIFLFWRGCRLSYSTIEISHISILFTKDSNKLLICFGDKQEIYMNYCVNGRCRIQQTHSAI